MITRHRILVLAGAAALAACADHSGGPAAVPQGGPQPLVRAANPAPESWGALTPPVLQARAPAGPLHLAAAAAGSLTPATLVDTMMAGETITEHKVATLPAAPPKGDVVFSMDLTGSMGGELNNMKTNAVNIMNAVSGVIGDVRFGVTSYEDYPAFYSSCGYASQYGSSGDRPFRVSRPLTAVPANVASSISALSLGNGFDGPESYSRALYETYAELTPAGAGTDGPLGWRPGAARIVVNFADNIPHDCDVGGPVGSPGFSTGRDPGRDGVVSTADDLPILDVLDGMKAHDITLINLYSNPDAFGISLWNAYAARVGGTNFVINPDGTIPGGTDIATAIAGLIQAQVSTVDSLTLQVCPGSEAFAPWIRGTSPGAYTGVTLPATKEFDLTLGPPAGTADGVYHFAVCVVGDGAEFGRQDVTIVVRNVVPVRIDIKPGSDPNSIKLNAVGDARIAVAVLSDASFDATKVVPSTVTLGDESGADTPVDTRNNGTLFASVSDVNGDGRPDLVLHFSRLALLANGDLTPATTFLVLRGSLGDGTYIRGTDAVRVIP
ncbi:MAG TPA: hypothetical protein VF092_02310 [Longimicrobium sp.]